MTKKLLSALLCSFTLTLFSIPAHAEENNTDNPESIAEQLGGEVISPEEVPLGITPIEFDSVEEAQEYIEEINQEIEAADDRFILDGGLGENEFASRLGKRAANNGVKTVSCDYSLGTFTIYANYEYNSTNNTFTNVTGVTSTYSGLTSTVEWVQDTYSNSITNNGKTLNVTVYGHFNTYVLVKNTMTKLDTINKTWYATWNWI